LDPEKHNFDCENMCISSCLQVFICHFLFIWTSWDACHFHSWYQNVFDITSFGINLGALITNLNFDLFLKFSFISKEYMTSLNKKFHTWEMGAKSV
jgi:hypothetical protein